MRVKIKNSMWENRKAYFFPVSEFNEYDGDEVQVKWLNAGQMALTTGDPSFSFRVLERKYIVSINEKPYKFVSAELQNKTFKVSGSKGAEYTVTIGQKNTCTCPGFTFRSTCKHVAEAVK